MSLIDSKLIEATDRVLFGDKQDIFKKTLR